MMHDTPKERGSWPKDPITEPKEVQLSYLQKSLVEKGWTAWFGGECPVEGSALIRVCLSSGVVSNEACASFWFSGASSDIVAWQRASATGAQAETPRTDAACIRFPGGSAVPREAWSIYDAVACDRSEMEKLERELAASREECEELRGELGRRAEMVDTSAQDSDDYRSELERVTAERDALQSTQDKILRMVAISEKANDEKSEMEVALSASFDEALAHTMLDKAEAQLTADAAEIERLRKDKERLDWAEEHLHEVVAHNPPSGPWFMVKSHLVIFKGDTLREAIDAALAPKTDL